MNKCPPNAIQAERREELGVLLREEVLQELVKEKVVFLLSEYLLYCLSHVMLMAWVSSDLWNSR